MWIRLFRTVLLCGVCVMPLLQLGAAEKNLDALAKCLTEKGVLMYGAFWCEHCREQKELFGDSFQHIHYVECHTPGTRAQNPPCVAAKVRFYPTWDFPDGTRLTGKQEPAELARRVGCKVR